MFLYKKEMDGIFFKDSKLLYFDEHDIVFYGSEGKIAKDVLINNPDMVRFVSDQKKVFVRSRHQFFHALLDTLAIILIEHKKDPDTLFIIHVDRSDYDLSFSSYHRYIEEVLRRNNVQYHVLKVSKENPVEINNFSFFKMYPLNIDAVEVVAEEGLKDSAIVEPTKKVYLGRAKIEFPKDDHLLFNDVDKSKFSADSDERIDDEEKIMKYFNSLGFETIYPEDFSSMEEQIYFFSQVKTIASVTTAGLANSIFMPKGGKVIELTVPLIVNGVESLHSVYQGISFAKRHKYMSIPHMRSTEEVIKTIEDDSILKAFICE
jgi:hypothetical protein